MTDKELLYIEDVLGHEQFIRQMCNDASQRVQDERLRNMINDCERRHAELFSHFYSLLGK
ncbi:hypothetical protein [Ruminococcus sp. NK3A76]|uniref:hypothetical protein n=1 Tax=Ruminococcus sp. NK3A76 TaxID=877411 RepID=UPI00048B1AE4|nr:hypothetical protein [Ruminococcus sp. NK3A76]